MAGYSTYAAMKGAIETLTRYQTKKLSSRKIRATTVAPSPIATNFGGGIVKKNLQFRTNAIAATDLGRIGEPDDIGGLVAFLCTDDAGWITAQRIEASGGMNLSLPLKMETAIQHSVKQRFAKLIVLILFSVFAVYTTIGMSRSGRMCNKW